MKKEALILLLIAAGLLLLATCIGWPVYGTPADKSIHQRLFVASLGHQPNEVKVGQDVFPVEKVHSMKRAVNATVRQLYIEGSSIEFPFESTKLYTDGEHCYLLADSEAEKLTELFVHEVPLDGTVWHLNQSQFDMYNDRVGQRCLGVVVPAKLATWVWRILVGIVVVFGFLSYAAAAALLDGECFSTNKLSRVFGVTMSITTLVALSTIVVVVQPLAQETLHWLEMVQLGLCFITAVYALGLLSASAIRFAQHMRGPLPGEDLEKIQTCAA